MRLWSAPAKHSSRPARGSAGTARLAVSARCQSLPASSGSLLSDHTDRRARSYARGGLFPCATACSPIGSYSWSNAALPGCGGSPVLALKRRLPTGRRCTSSSPANGPNVVARPAAMRNVTAYCATQTLSACRAPHDWFRAPSARRFDAGSRDAKNATKYGCRAEPIWSTAAPSKLIFETISLPLEDTHLCAQMAASCNL